MVIALVSFEDFKNYKDWISGLPLIIGISVLFLYLVIFKPEVLMRFRACFLSMFTWIGTSVKRKQIESYVNANILKASKEATKEIADILPYDLKIQWVTKTDREAFLQDNNVVVCVDNKRNKMHTIVHALSDFVENGLLTKERHCIDNNIFKSSCLIMTRKLLMSTYEEGVSYFFQGVLSKEMEDDEELKDSINKLSNLDDNGMFVQIMLRELKEKSNQVFGKIDNSGFIIETKEFIDFLYQIAVRKNGDNSTQLAFNGNYYKVGIMLVAKWDTYENFGESVYIERLKMHLAKGTSSIYLFGRDQKIRIVRMVSRELDKMEYVKHFKKTYKIKFKKELSYVGKRVSGETYDGISVHMKIEKKA
ncbi:hypothetical protein HYG86_09065 [Alkalicella caledoniensis]|uniref:Uncharacterized protein n=1 Tax=Alkalicella caledoniensis TaxID=2731377 RepID=A0A7G9W899_ALKCA|nr:hypothetical protein [Alkalicella caledoniensis]QNO14911.1 hypothetical protein HYG86_09065 [Alkalicella caledoniensis]